MSIPIALPPPVRVGVADRWRAHATVLAAHGLLTATRRRPALRRHLLRLLRRRTRPAGVDEVRRAHRAITAVSLHCASSHGCLPRSLAIVLWCRATGQHATWVLGASVDPPAALHAWVEAAHTSRQPRASSHPSTVRPPGPGGGLSGCPV